MFKIQKKKRIIISALVAVVFVLPAVVFAVSRLNTANDTSAITYVMPDGYPYMTDPNLYDCAVEAYKKTYPAIEIPTTGLTLEQLNTIDTLVCNSRQDGEKIVNTTGLERMPRMAYLDLGSNNISSIDVSSFPNLTYLDLHSNNLSSINLSNNTLLTNLYLNSNSLTSVNISSNGNLREIDFSSNSLSYVNFSNNTRLVSLKLQSNQITSLDLSHNTALTKLIVKNNQLVALDLSNNTRLNDLISDNIIIYTNTTPTISGNSHIYTLGDLGFIQDGYHEGYTVAFSIDDTSNYSYNKSNMTLTVTNPANAGSYVQINGVDDREEGGFSYKFGLPFVLTFDANGGSGSIESQICWAINTVSGTCDVTIPSTEPTRNGYNFLGWAESSGATSATYSAGGNVNLSTSKTLYAVWREDSTAVRLSFELDDGEGNVPEQSCSITAAAPTCVVTIPNITPTKNGYSFLGWADSSGAISATYSAGGSVTLSANKTIYAVWQLVTRTVILNFERNQGEGIVAPRTCIVSVETPSCSITIPNEAPTREGYTFLGWADSRDATSAAYVAGGSITISDTKTIYAVWQLVTRTATLNFDRNNGEGIVAPRTCTISVETPTCSITIPNEAPTREGYTFLGWADSRDATSAAYVAGGSITISDTKTIHAVWKLITTTLTLDYDLNGGEGSIPVQTCTISIENSTCDVTIPSASPSKEGYHFVGWEESVGTATVRYGAGDKVTLEGDKTVYAAWEEGEEEPGDDTPNDEQEIPVPDTSAPETGAYTADHSGAIITFTVLPVVSAAVYRMIRRRHHHKMM